MMSSTALLDHAFQLLYIDIAVFSFLFFVILTLLFVAAWKYQRALKTLERIQKATVIHHHAMVQSAGYESRDGPDNEAPLVLNNLRPPPENRTDLEEGEAAGEALPAGYSVIGAHTDHALSRDWDTQLPALVDAYSHLDHSGKEATSQPGPLHAPYNHLVRVASPSDSAHSLLMTVDNDILRSQLSPEPRKKPAHAPAAAAEAGFRSPPYAVATPAGLRSKPKKQRKGSLSTCAVTPSDDQLSSSGLGSEEERASPDLHTDVFGMSSDSPTSAHASDSTSSRRLSTALHPSLQSVYPDQARNSTHLVARGSPPDEPSTEAPVLAPRWTGNVYNVLEVVPGASSADSSLSSGRVQGLDQN